MLSKRHISLRDVIITSYCKYKQINYAVCDLNAIFKLDDNITHKLKIHIFLYLYIFPYFLKKKTII